MRYNRRFLVKSDLVSSWEGVVHEYLQTEGPWSQAGEAYVSVGTDGARNKNPLKFLKDAYTLEEALETEPNNSRNLFYLAQSYRDFRDHNYYILAEKLYLQRVENLKYPEERYISFLEAGKCRLYRGKNNEKTLNLFMQAFSFRPERLEAAYYIVKYFRAKKLYAMGYHFGKHLLDTRISEEDNLFIDTDIYTWKFKDEVAICAFWSGDKTLYLYLYNTILKEDIPKEARFRVERDLSQFV
tara:strand:+ start:76 stop:798 length:723 start_codon:yes stop_codon:yes gene_type:complete